MLFVKCVQRKFDHRAHSAEQFANNHWIYGRNYGLWPARPKFIFSVWNKFYSIREQRFITKVSVREIVRCYFILWTVLEAICEVLASKSSIRKPIGGQFTNSSVQPVINTLDSLLTTLTTLSQQPNPHSATSQLILLLIRSSFPSNSLPFVLASVRTCSSTACI